MHAPDPPPPATTRPPPITRPAATTPSAPTPGAWVLGGLAGVLAGFTGLGLLFAGAWPVLPMLALAVLVAGALLGGWGRLPVRPVVLLMAGPAALAATGLVPAAWRSSGVGGALLWAAVPAGLALAAAGGAALARRRRAR